MSKHGNKAKCFRIGQKSGKTGQFKQKQTNFLFLLGRICKAVFERFLLPFFSFYRAT